MPDTTKTPFASATPSRLVGAYVIDMLVLGALLAATWLVYFTPLTITLITVEAVIAAGIMLGATGRTPGMAAMRVCLIRDEDDAQTPSLGAAMGYIALTALLQITIVGPLACLAMARDGRTWLTGPTRTRLVDLRQHAALAAGPGAAGMAGYSERPRPGSQWIRERSPGERAEPVGRPERTAHARSAGGSRLLGARPARQRSLRARLQCAFCSGCAPAGRARCASTGSPAARIRARRAGSRALLADSVDAHVLVVGFRRACGTCLCSAGPCARSAGHLGCARSAGARAVSVLAERPGLVL